MVEMVVMVVSGDGVMVLLTLVAGMGIMVTVTGGGIRMYLEVMIVMCYNGKYGGNSFNYGGDYDSYDGICK